MTLKTNFPDPTENSTTEEESMDSTDSIESNIELDSMIDTGPSDHVRLTVDDLVTGPIELANTESITGHEQAEDENEE